MDNENSALELWRRWLKFSGDPYVMDMDSVDEGCWIDKLCFFCGGRKSADHASDCVYIAATKLLNVEATCK